MPPLIASQKYDWQSTAISPPLNLIVGDTITHVGNQIVVTRSGVVVETRTIGALAAVSETVAESQTITSAIFLRMRPVSGVVATLIDVSKNTSTGAITGLFSDGNSLEFANGAQIMSETDYIDTDNVLCKHVLMRKTMLNSPDETNLTTMVGATCTVDCNATQPMSVRVD